MKRIDFVKFLLGVIAALPFFFFEKKKENCYTDQDVEGPFFRNGAPKRFDLANGYEGKGKELLVEGYVFGDDCTSTLSNALIEIWHASPNGNYDLDSDKYLFRGKILTNAQGFYSFKTLIPKGYKDGPLDRPKHIHYKIQAEHHKELVTQLYFKGDEKLKNDPFVINNKGDKRTMDLEKLSEDSYKIHFNIYLSK